MLAEEKTETIFNIQIFFKKKGKGKKKKEARTMVDWLHISLESAMNHRHKKKKRKSERFATAV